ncbi:hypothetical protein ACX40Y_15300 [Sphingomonas sp. RS6]
MPETDDDTGTEARIEQALARIEAATAACAYSAARLERRHALLRERVEAAITALDTLIDEEPDAGPDAEPDAGDQD